MQAQAFSSEIMELLALLARAWDKSTLVEALRNQDDAIAVADGGPQEAVENLVRSGYYEEDHPLYAGYMPALDVTVMFNDPQEYFLSLLLDLKAEVIVANDQTLTDEQRDYAYWDVRKSLGTI